MKKGDVQLSLILFSAAALGAASPSAAYFKGDAVFAADDTAYCRSIADLQVFTAALKAKLEPKAGKPMPGCGTLAKDSQAVAVDTSYHGYAVVRLKTPGGGAANVYVQKNLWWTKQEEKYFTCMRVRSEEPFLEAYKHCQEVSVSGVDAKATPDLAVAYACAECHGATGKNAKPNLVGMSKEYILKSVNAYKTGARSDSSMAKVANKLDEADAARAAAYFSATQCK